MKNFLLDTNICIYLLKGLFNIHRIIEQVGPENCMVSEITIAELKYGAENSEYRERNRKVVNQFSLRFGILPIFRALDTYAVEKARLKKEGLPLDDLDLFIGTTAMANNLILVTRDVSHFQRLNGIELQNWVDGDLPGLVDS